MNQPLRGAPYARQSKGNPKSIKDQLTIGRRRLADEGITQVAEFSDKVSASRHTTKQRDDWALVNTMVDNGELDVLWLWEPSRGDRKAEVWLPFLARCRDQGMALLVDVDDRTYDLTNPRDYKAMAMAGVDAEYESDQTQKRTMRAKNELRADALAGTINRPDGGLKAILGGKARYGWTDPGIKQPWRVDPIAAAVLQEVTQRLLAKEELMSIYRDLIDRLGQLRDSYGVPVSYGRLNATLRMPVTGGMLADRDGTIIGKVADGPVDAAAWKQLHALFTARPEGRYAKDEYPLGKVLTCACGNQLTGEKNGPDRYYSCRNDHKGTTACHGTFIRADALHKHVAAALARWAKTSPRARALSTPVDYSPQRAALTVEWEELKERMGNLERKLRTNRIDRDEYAQSEAFIEARFAEIEAERTMLDTAESNPMPVLIDWEAMSRDDKRRLVAEAFITPIVVGPVVKPGPYQQVSDRVHLEVRPD